MKKILKIVMVSTFLTVFLGSCGKKQKGVLEATNTEATANIIAKTSSEDDGKEHFSEIEKKEINIEEFINLEDLTSIIGADGIELNYADDNRLIFHSFAGLFICEKDEEDWKATQTLDLASLEANMTQGDNASLIYADKDEVWILPKRYALDNENPVTYKYLISEDRLEKIEGFSDQIDSALQWSYSEEGTKLYKEIQQQTDLFCSNLYPINGIDEAVYGFIAVNSEGLNSLQYGCYYKDTSRLEMKSIIVDEKKN